MTPITPPTKHEASTAATNATNVSCSIRRGFIPVDSGGTAHDTDTVRLGVGPGLWRMYAAPQ